MVSQNNNIIYVGNYQPKNLMQAGLEQEEPTQEEITNTLLAFANNDRKLFIGRSRRNLLQGGTFKGKIKQAGTEEKQT